MKTLLLLAVLALPAASQDSQQSIPWGTSERSGLSVLLLPQFGPPQSIAPREVNPPKSEGFMLTINSSDLASEAKRGARIRFKVYATAVLKNGQYAFEYKEVEYSDAHATTVFFPVGPTAKVATLRIDVETLTGYDLTPAT